MTPRQIGKMKIEWDRDPREVLKNVQRAMRNKIARKAVRQASTILKKEVKRNAPKDKSGSPQGYPGGALKKTTGTKVYVPKRNKDVVVGIVGANNKFTAVAPGVKIRGPKKGQPRLKKPGKYQHLVNKGRRKGRGIVAPTDYLDKSLQNQWPAMEQAMKNIIGVELTKAFA